jgi:hypothetical protein
VLDFMWPVGARRGLSGGAGEAGSMERERRGALGHI